MGKLTKQAIDEKCANCVHWDKRPELLPDYSRCKKHLTDTYREAKCGQFREEADNAPTD